MKLATFIKYIYFTVPNNMQHYILNTSISFNINISHQFFDYRITFVNLQHKKTNLKSEFVFKNWVLTLFKDFTNTKINLNKKYLFMVRFPKVIPVRTVLFLSTLLQFNRSLSRKENSYSFSSSKNDSYNTLKILLFLKLYIRQGKYWRIPFPRFLVAWNDIKMRCSK